MNHYFVHDTHIGEIILEAILDRLTNLSFNRKNFSRIRACSIKKEPSYRKKR